MRAFPGGVGHRNLLVRNFTPDRGWRRGNQTAAGRLASGRSNGRASSARTRLGRLSICTQTRRFPALTSGSRHLAAAAYLFPQGRRGSSGFDCAGQQGLREIVDSLCGIRGIGAEFQLLAELIRHTHLAVERRDDVVARGESALILGGHCPYVLQMDRHSGAATSAATGRGGRAAGTGGRYTSAANCRTVPLPRREPLNGSVDRP